MLTTRPPSAPAEIPQLRCETPIDRAAFEQLQITWSANYEAYEAAEKAFEDADKSLEEARKAYNLAGEKQLAADKALEVARQRQVSAQAITQADNAYEAARAAAAKAGKTMEQARAAKDRASGEMSLRAANIRQLNEAWNKLLADISQRKCVAPAPPAAAPAPPPPPPPPTGNPPPAPPAAKAKCPACEKLDADIAAVDAKIASLERSIASLRQNGNLKDPNVQNAVKSDEAKLADLKAQREALQVQKAKCGQTCVPRAASDGYVASVGCGGGPASSEFETAVLGEINAARADPAGYAAKLQTYRGYLRGRQVDEPGRPTAMTTEGAAAVDDAIAFLGKRSPLPPLAPSDGLALASHRLVADLVATGEISHVGAGGSTMRERMQAACVWAGAMEEDISVAQRTPADVVRQLVIDDGVPSRGHRTAIFSRVLKIAGVACAKAAGPGNVCVVDFAGALMPAPGSER